MAKLKSIFGAYADNLQLVINQSADRFAPLWFPSRFPWAPQQVSLTYTSIRGGSGLEAASSVVSRDASTPLRSRRGLSKMSGEIPAIKEMYMMSESDYRDFLVMQSMSVPDTQKRDQMLDFIFNDTLKVGNGAMKRLDYLVLEGLSTAQITLNTDNNPDGLTLSTAIDLEMPSGNKITATAEWSDSVNGKPIGDIQAVAKKAMDLGKPIATILMSKSLFGFFIKTKEVIDTLAAFYYGPKPGGSFNPVSVTTLDNVNEFLTKSLLPTIELVDVTIGIEKDGVVSPKRPFSEKNAVFIPAGPLGVIKNAIAIEQSQPVAGVSYATFNRALISKWSDNEPFGEWTKSELNAFPSFDTIDGNFLLKAIN